MHVSRTPDSLIQLLEIRPLGVDELSTARYVVGAAFQRSAKDYYSASEIEAFADFVRSPHFGDILLGNRAYCAWVGSEMVAVGAWGVGEAQGLTARILTLFVHPLFGNHGLGTRLADYIADDARAAGFRALETSATLCAAGFFERLGYVAVRNGVWRLPSGRELPVVSMRHTADARADLLH